MVKNKPELDIDIRKYVDRDHNEVIRLILDVLVNEFKLTLDFDKLDSDLIQIERHYNVTAGGCFWVCEINKNIEKSNNEKSIIATTAIRRLDEFESTAELKRMYVSKEYRGNGIGQRMLN